MDAVLSFLNSVFGIDTNELSLLHVLARSVVIYMVGILLMRIGKKRSVGKMTAFDIILAIIIGSLLSRAITKKDLFLENLAASALLMLMHRLFARIAIKNQRFGNLIKGHERILVEDGVINWDSMKESNLSEQDLMQTLRLNSNTDDLSKVKTARHERNGDISFILRE